MTLPGRKHYVQNTKYLDNILKKRVYFSYNPYTGTPMKLISIFILLAATSCSSLPLFYQAAEDIADDNAVRVEIQKESLQKDTNVRINVDVINKPDTK